jgi:hypothetical protein
VEVTVVAVVDRGIVVVVVVEVAAAAEQVESQF